MSTAGADLMTAVDRWTAETGQGLRSVRRALADGDVRLARQRFARARAIGQHVPPDQAPDQSPQEWVAQLLADGPLPRRRVLDAGQTAGFGLNDLGRLRTRGVVKSIRISNPSGVLWVLPDQNAGHEP